ncbi:cation channel sperm-associated protein subunit zeta isoform X2 [Meles meles]|uniref:cation channel sperm-associated protein subunit zeta isoform X2 n=1 Tax=Meles meles TaxID=9662 RepID=UPI001E69F5B0|nr:cation channel sperm-associated protein subunit zeta isoform X2 [Meles meles]
MEEKPFRASLGSRASDLSNPEDIRNLWTRATLSQPKLNVARSSVGEDSDMEEDLDKPSLLELELSRARSLGSGLEEQDGDSKESKTDTEMSSSESSLNISKHTPHRAYWMEQQNRLPLPLMDLMENEALEILTKALRSYRSGIGRDHFLTKQLQRHIEGLRRRRNKRLRFFMH